MKIRNGFVSNSSSSSFIVAFSKKPESIEDVMKELYPGSKKFDSVDYYNNTTTVEQICDNVFCQIKNDSDEKSGLGHSSFEEMLQARYHYPAGVDPARREGFYNSGESFWGTDKKVLEKLQEENVKYETEDEEISKELDAHVKKLLSTKKLKEPKYADPEYKEYSEKREMVLNRDLKHSQLYDKKRKLNNAFYESKRKLEEKLAKSDFKTFLDKNPNKFICKFNFADDTSLGSICEHGGIFGGVPYIQINNH